MIAAVAVVAVVLLGAGGEDYRVTAQFQNAGQLVRGNNVQVAGVSIGTVEDIRLSRDGQAQVELNITDPDYAPLRDGTEAIVRQASLSGVANRYVDLRLAGADRPDIPNGGRIETADTTSAVDIDQLFNTFTKQAQKSLQGVVRGFGRQYRDVSEPANRGWLYLNPSLAASSRFFEELTLDDPALERFVVATSQLVTDVAERRDDLAGLVTELADFTGALARRKSELADAISQLPPFMRRANTTFVNLRGAVDDLRPLVEESKPVAKKLRPFFAELRPLARDARPTLRDLQRLLRTGGADNDLVELTRGQVPLARAALRPREVNGATRRGAFPETAQALRDSLDPVAFFRPYSVDLTGWFDDFGHSGLYDALGGKSRVGAYVNAFANVEGVLKPIVPGLRDDVARRFTANRQTNRCPGAAEHPAPDGSNPYKPSPDFNCDPSQRLPGN